MASSTTLKLKQQRSRERREQILAAATKLFGEKGIDRTSLTDIAATAKVPLSSIYDYFADKRALVLEVPEENFAALYQRTEPLLSKGSDPVEQLKITFLTNFEYISENPSWGRVFFLEIWPSVIAAEPQIKRPSTNMRCAMYSLSSKPFAPAHIARIWILTPPCP